MNGSLNTSELVSLRRLLAHEYVKSKLMDIGLPCHSTHPDVYATDRGNSPTDEHFDPHDIAPYANVNQPPFYLWERLNRSPGSLTLANDLSNIDEVVMETYRLFVGD